MRGATVLASLALCALSRGALAWCRQHRTTTYSRARHELFSAGFAPGAGFGGFGGSDIAPSRVPVVFIHGNGDTALGWNDEPTAVPGFPAPPRSVYAEFKAAGYTGSELFGVTWLAPSEQAPHRAPRNYHCPEKYDLLATFLERVCAYTGAPRLDVVGHSMGVTLTLAALEYAGLWQRVRRVVNIAGAVRGLTSSYLAGHANPLIPTCQGQHPRDPYTFGFFPEGWYAGQYVANEWTGKGTPRSLRQMPRHHPDVAFYTISAGRHDQLLSPGAHPLLNADDAADFENGKNVIAQLNVGAGSEPTIFDWRLRGGAMVNRGGGDRDGVGHLRVRSNTGSIVRRMLTTDCRGIDCTADYGYGPAHVY